MLEWLSSKMSVVLASMLLLSSMTAYFANQRDYARRQELETVARGLSSFVNAVFGVHGTTEFEVSFAGGGDLVLPSRIGGSPYSVRMRSDSVVIEQYGGSAIGHWSGNLHFWTWDGATLTWESVNASDRNRDSLSLGSGQGFQVSVEEIVLSESRLFFVFARLAP